MHVEAGIVLKYAEKFISGTTHKSVNFGRCKNVSSGDLNIVMLRVISAMYLIIQFLDH
jgi:hypothetical protein